MSEKIQEFRYGTPNELMHCRQCVYFHGAMDIHCGCYARIPDDVHKCEDFLASNKKSPLRPKVI